MNGISLYYVNKHLYSGPLLGLKAFENIVRKEENASK